jgi:hypothetical protein
VTRAWQVLRPFRWIAALWIVYGGLHLILAQISAHRGILSPDGAIDRGYAIFAIVVLGLRLVVLALVPTLVAYRLAMRAATAIAARRRT